jgi:type I restriction enzyme S subunit
MATEADILLPVIGKLPPRWRAVEFGAVLDGGTRNGIYKTKEFHGRGAKMVNMGELFGHPRLRNVEMRRVELNENELERFRIGAGDLLFARRSLVAEGAGKCCIVLEANETTTFESSIIRARPNPREADSLFLFYLFKSPFGTHVLGSILRHVAVAGITGSDLVKLRIPIPPLAEQRTIAQILNALDEKIELNRRMNETLEALAQTIFKSWFVDATATKLPKGWRAGTLGEVAENPRRSIQPDEIKSSMSYIGLEHLPRRSIALSDWESDTKLGSNKLEFKRGEILFGKLRPYFHKVGVAPLDGVCSTDILVVRPKMPEWFGFVLGHVSSVELVNHTDAASTGTKMPRTNWNDLARFEVALPPESLAAEFTATIRPMIDRIIANIHESRTLAELRDALLPKLLSGEFRVKEAYA